MSRREKKVPKPAAKAPETFNALLTGVSIDEVTGNHPMDNGRAWQFVLTAMQNEPPGNNPPTMAFLLFERQVIDLYNLLRGEVEKAGLDKSTPLTGGPLLQ